MEQRDGHNQTKLPDRRWRWPDTTQLLSASMQAFADKRFPLNLAAIEPDDRAARA